MKGLYHILLILFIGGILKGQDSPDLIFTRFGMEDGLPNMTMNVLGQDSTGYIWLANPLTRFDGKNFKTYREHREIGSSSLISATSITDDGKGNLFFAGPEGIYYYDTILQYVHKIPSLPFNSSKRSILKSGPNTFWDYSHYNLCKIELPNFDTTNYYVPELKDVNDIFSVPGDSKIWIIQNKNNLKLLDLKTLKIHEYPSTIINDLESAMVVIGKDMTLWVITHLGIHKFDEIKNDFVKIFKYDEYIKDKNWRFNYTSFQLGNKCWWIIDRLNNIIYKFNFDTFQFNIINIFKQSINYNFSSLKRNQAIEMHDSKLLLGSTQKGLFVINPLNGNINQFLAEENNKNSLFNNSAIPEFCIDENSFLITGLGQGLIKADIKKSLFDTYIPPISKENEAYSKNVRSILEWNDNLIVGSISNINLFNLQQKTFEPLPMPGNLPSPHPEEGALAITSDSLQNLLITYWHQSSEAHIYYLDYINNCILDLTDFFPETSFSASNCLFTDSNDNFWIAIQSGVVRISAEFLSKGNLEDIRKRATFFSFKNFQPSVQDLHKIYTISEDKKGRIWVGTNSGLFKINPGTEMIVAFKNVPDDIASLSGNDVRSLITTSDGFTWIGTYNGGLNKYLEKNNSFERYTTKEGLTDNTIYTIAEDNEKKMWLGTNKGLCRFDPKLFHSHQYLPSDGVQNYEFNTNAVCKTKDGRLIFGGINGFNMFDPLKLKSSRTTNNLVISSFKVNDKDRPTTSKHLSLAFDENFLEFEFNLLEFYQSDKIQYAIKLEGLESDWNFIGNTNTASYPGLRPGLYTFKVKAASSDGHWSDHVIQKPISIAPPWWQSWWFILSITCIMLSVLYILYKNKQDQKERIIQLRHQISQDLHDEIGSTLSSISLFGTVAQKLSKTDQEGTEQMLSRINDSTTQVMESMNDIVWAINSNNDKIDNLFKRMRAFTSELSDASSIHANLEVDEGIKEASISMVQRRNVYLIFKEAINNAFKYSQASKIDITLKQKKKMFQLRIIDDGIGFDKQLVGSSDSLGGNGLKNMSIRALELDGVLEVVSKIGQGTTIDFIWNPKYEPPIKKA